MADSTRYSCRLDQQEEFWVVIASTLTALLDMFPSSPSVKIAVTDPAERERWLRMGGEVEKEGARTFGPITVGHDLVRCGPTLLRSREAVEYLWGSTSEVTIVWHGESDREPRLQVEKSDSDGITLVAGTDHEFAAARSLLLHVAAHYEVPLKAVGYASE